MFLPAEGTPIDRAKDTAKLTATPPGSWVPESYVEPVFLDESMPDNDGHLGN